MKIDDFQPATGVGRFAVKLAGNELKVKMRIYIDSALDPAELAKFQLQCEPIIKNHWENKYGFQCTNPAYPGVYKPVFKIVFETGPGTAHWVMTMTDGVTASVGRDPWWKSNSMGLTNAPKSVKMRPDAARDVGEIRGALSGQILESLRNSFPFYADAPGGSLSSHAKAELKTLGKEIKKLDAGAVLTVTAYGSNKAAAQNAVIAVLNGAGVANVLKRKSKKVFASNNPRTGSSNYVKVVLKSGLGHANPSTVGLFHYPATIVHEFGHMLGLVDEYACLSKSAADKMAELDFIHPKEAALFQEYHAPGASPATSDSAQSQTILAEYCKKAGCEPAQYGTRTISIMSSGSKFYPRHFVTLWAAVVELTKLSSAESEWSIVKL